MLLYVVPTAPKDLHFMDFTSTSVTLIWKRPDPPNGLITHYNVSDITNDHCLY